MSETSWRISAFRNLPHHDNLLNLSVLFYKWMFSTGESTTSQYKKKRFFLNQLWKCFRLISLGLQISLVVLFRKNYCLCDKQFSRKLEFILDYSYLKLTVF